MKNYDHKKIELKVQKEWEKKKIYQAKDGIGKKFYGLIEFPYPSGDGLHVGHPRPYIGMDVISRKRRMQGFNVLYPIGWDAFGLPTENYAIKTGKDPRIVTKKNSDTFRRQIKSLGISFDWGREINTTNPKYYKWTQWIFLQFWKHGLAYKAKSSINWCPKDKIGLANEEAVGSICDRCGSQTEKREKEQWMLAITKYADRLDKDLDLVNYPERVKIQQRNWIGKSEGSEIEFIIKSNANCIIVHGSNSSEQQSKEGGPENLRHWKQWLKRSLEKKGIKVSNELYPEDWLPDYRKWKKVFERNNINENSILIGHSAGAAFLLRWLNENKRKVDKLVLVAPSVIKTDKYIRLSKLKDFSYNSSLKKYFNEVVTFYSDNDNEHIIKSSQEVYSKLGGKLVNLKNKGHFILSDMGTEEFPELLDEIVSKIKAFTTRPDTLFGATYLVLAPEHPLLQKLLGKVGNKKEVEEYVKNSKKKSELERTVENKEKTGVELKGIKAINPGNGKEIPVWIADYVLLDYGTGAIMAVPAHDERDLDFAKKYNLPVKKVLEPLFVSESGVNAVRKDLPFVHRNAVCAIVVNPKNGKYLCVSWKKFLMHGLITGGIEQGEDRVEGALREIHEETGYKNVKFIKDSGIAIHSLFYHRVKEENRWARFQYLFFELVDEARDPLSKEDLDLHDVLWKSKEELKDFLSVIEGKFVLNIIGGKEYIYTGDGILVNSGKYDGLQSEEAKKKITEAVGGKVETKFKLRDWVFSRQRYWGEPIPLIDCNKCGLVPVPEKDLPVKLPEVKSYKPTDTGESPLASIAKWVNVKCPKCQGPGKRETDTMPNWAGSSWYYLRYADPKNSKVFADQKKLKYWTPVDWYNGGMEHTTLHLLYSRFWHKFLYDLKLVPTVEPYQKRTSHGMILGEGGVKMSKSVGNVINPDDIVKTYGADTLRIYEMFMGPFEDAVVWSTESIIGSRRFVEKVWRIGQREFAKVSDIDLEKTLHKTIKKVTEDIESMRFNTAISSMMILTSEMEKAKSVSVNDFKMFLQILAPFAPHVAEAIWLSLGEKKSIHLSTWPKWDENLAKDREINIAVQVNGKVRAEILIQTGEAEESVKKKALENQAVLKYLAGKNPKKVIYVKNRVINILS